MKIGIIHGSFKTIGGSEKVASLLIKIFKENGYDVDFYFSNGADDTLIKKIFGDLLDSVKVHKFFN